MTEDRNDQGPKWMYAVDVHYDWQCFHLGCHIHNGTYLTLFLTLTIMLSPTNPNRNSKGNPNPTNPTNLVLGTVVNTAP